MEILPGTHSNLEKEKCRVALNAGTTREGFRDWFTVTHTVSTSGRKL